MILYQAVKKIYLLFPLSSQIAAFISLNDWLMTSIVSVSCT